jgi:hypothetical protein
VIEGVRVSVRVPTVRRQGWKGALHPPVITQTMTLELCDWRGPWT